MISKMCTLMCKLKLICSVREVSTFFVHMILIKQIIKYYLGFNSHQHTTMVLVKVTLSLMFENDISIKLLFYCGGANLFFS